MSFLGPLIELKFGTVITFNWDDLSRCIIEGKVMSLMFQITGFPISIMGLH